MAKNERESVQSALLVEHAAKHTPGAKVTLPNNVRVSAEPYIGMRYQGMDATQMLGDPAGILKAPRPGHKYVWKKRSDKQTAAWVRSGILRPVEPDEVDSSNPAAEYAEDISGTNHYVTWEQLTLFEMSPKWVKRIYQDPEDWSIARIAQEQQNFADVVDRTTRGKFTGSTTITKG